MSDSKTNPFSDLGLRDEITKTLSDLGYEAPTPIQERTIPVLLSGRDLIGQAQTGTGKTAAFALPMLERIDLKSHLTQALVLAPTRELAMQVAEAIHSYSRNLGSVSVVPVYGGAPMVVQLKALQRGAQIVVGTPGRLIDHLDRKTLDLKNLKMIVLDEADEMLKMGFQEEVERILSSASTERQVALFSATMPREVLRISERYLKDPVRVEIEHKALTTPAIEQRFLNISEGQKLEVLTQILEVEESEAVLIFRRTKNGAAELAEKLQARGFAAEAMHGDMTQPLRESVIRRLKKGTVEIVVATDVAARGLDVEKISHVINYDVPHDVEVYVHRIGRTGRAGRSGLATIFITPRERRMLREIERFTGIPIKPMPMPSRADVAAKRIALFKETLRKSLAEGDLDLYVGLVEQLVDEGGHDMAEVAAAAARLANNSRSLAAEPEQAGYEQARTARHNAAFADERPGPAAKRERAPAYERPERDRSKSAFPPPPRDREKSSGADVQRELADEPKVRLQIGVGKQDGIRPADIVGSIANEADVPGREIGPIDIRDQITIVVVPAKYRDQILEKTARAKFRGRALNLKELGPVGPDESFVKPARPSARPGPRSASGSGSSTRSYGSRETSSRSFKPSETSGRTYKPKADAPSRYRDRNEETPRGFLPRESAAKMPYVRDESTPQKKAAPRAVARPSKTFTKKDDSVRKSAPAKTGFYSSAPGAKKRTGKVGAKPFVKKGPPKKK